MPRVKACSVDDLNSGAMLQVEVDGRDPIAVYRLDDGFYATDDICTHGAAYLTEGDIEGDEIYCPFHAGAFDIRTGEPSAAPCVVALKTHPVVVENDEVFVEVEDQ